MADRGDDPAPEADPQEVLAQVGAILGCVPVGVVVYDAGGRIVRSNAAADAILGYGPRERDVPVAERLARGPLEWLTEDGRPVSADDSPAMRAAVHGETRSGVLLRCRRAGEEERWVSVSAAPLLVRGERTGAVVSISDVTDRRRAEQALRCSEEEARSQAAQLEAILQCVADGVIVYDREGRTIRSTPAADEILGIPAAERTVAVQDRVMRQYEIFAEDGRRLGRDEMAAVRAAVRAEPTRGEVLRIRPTAAGAGERWVRLNAIPLRLDGDHRGAVLSLTDITDRKQAELALQAAHDRLRETDQRKDEFLAVLSHELRNPLAPIRNSLFILDRTDPGAPAAQRARAVANRQVAHLARLVDDLLDVTRIARGRIELRRADLDVVALARRVVDDHRALLDARGLSLALEAPAAPVVVHGDETRLAQVLGNLLTNAAKFTPPSGRVVVSVARDPGRAVLRVRDTGPGFDPALLGSLFEPFTQAKQTLARSEGGLGLGLALVRGLVEQHGGAVSAAAGPGGCGAEVTVTLPLAAAP